MESARKLTEAFNGHDLDFWIDWEGIPPTVDWWKEIEKGIEEADIFLFLISPDSARSKVCKLEIEAAVRNGKRLIPIVVRDIKGDEAPAELGHLNWIFLRKSDDFISGFDKLMTAIKTDYEWTQTHRQLQVKALEWERSGHENSFLLRGKELQNAELQLATNSSKEPHPTGLQRDYVFKSRKETDRLRRITTIIAIVGVIALVVLAAFGFVQAGIANTNAKEAQSQAATAQAASTLAVANEVTAIANEKLAEERAEIALARQLAAQAQSIYTTDPAKQEIAVLLGIQSMQLFPTDDAIRILHNNTLPYQISRMTVDGRISSVFFSPDERYLVSMGAGSNSRIQIWDAFTGDEISRMTHDLSVISVAISPDGKYIVSGSFDNTARVWETSTGNEIARVTYDVPVIAVAFSPDGKFILTGVGDRTVRVSEKLTGIEITRVDLDIFVSSITFTLDGNYIILGGCDGLAESCVNHTTHVRNYSLDQEGFRIDGITKTISGIDGKYGLSVKNDRKVLIWEISTGREVAQLAHDDHVTSVASSLNGNYVVSGGWDNTSRVWETSTGEEITRMNFGGWVNSVDISPDGRLAAAGSRDNIARVWETQTGKEVARIAHESDVYSIKFSPSGKYIASGGCELLASSNNACIQSSIRVWEIAPGNEVARITFDEAATFAAFTSDGSHFVTVNNNNNATIWERATGKEVARIPYENRLNFTRDGKYIFTSKNDLVIFWDSATGREISRIYLDDIVYDAAFTTDGKYLVTGDRGTARVWETTTGEEVAGITHMGWVSAVAFSQDAKYIISGGENDTQIWETSTGESIVKLTNASNVSFVAFGPDGSFAIIKACNQSSIINHSCPQSNILIIEAVTGKQIAVIQNVSTSSPIALSPDGRFLVSTNCDSVIADSVNCLNNGLSIWETVTGHKVAHLPHFGWIYSTTFSSDGYHVVTGGTDAIFVWETLTGNEVSRMFHEVAYRVAFTADDKFVISGGGVNKTVLTWLWQPADLILNACSRVTRNLTGIEWVQYFGLTIPYQVICDNLPGEPEMTSTP